LTEAVNLGADGVLVIVVGECPSVFTLLIGAFPGAFGLVVDENLGTFVTFPCWVLLLFAPSIAPMGTPCTFGVILLF